MTSNRLLIKNVRNIDPGQKTDTTGDIYIVEGLIHSTGKLSIKEKCDVIDGGGLIACPGFIDLHCHLREPGQEHKETIASGAAAAAKGGFTAICCMPNSLHPVDNLSVVEYIKRKAAGSAAISVLPVGCLTRGRSGKEITEMAELAGAGCIGFSDDGCSVASSRIMSLALEYAASLDLPVIDHCEDAELSQGGQVNDGWVAVRLGLKGIPAAAEEAIVARDIALAEMTGARLHLTHISTKGSVELIRAAKSKGFKVTADTTPHHLTLTAENVIINNPRPGIPLSYDTCCKVNPPLRAKEDVIALIRGLNDGIIDSIATDHAPHTAEDKLCEFESASFGISGFETAFGVLMTLVHENKMSLMGLIECLTAAPAAILGDRPGVTATLKPGSPANITLLDIDREWTVNSAEFLSWGKNTPYNGKLLKGRVMGTLHSGKLVYNDTSLNISGA